MDRRWSAAAAAFGRWPPAAVVWIAAASLTAIFGIFALVLYASRLDVESAAWTASTNLAAAISQDVQREFELLDMSLLTLRDGAEQPQVMLLPPSLRQQVLFDRAGSASGLGALLLLDAQGRVTEQAGVAVPKPVDLSGAVFFQVHRDRSDAGLFVSRPFVSLIDGETSIAVSRRIERQGVFAGVAVGTIKVAYFQNLIERLDLGPHGSMSLILDDGTLVVRKPFLQAAAGRLLPNYDKSLQRIGSTASGSFDQVSRMDGVRRQYFYNRVGTLPLVQFVGRSRQDTYAAWWMRTALTALAMFLLGNTILLLIVVLHVELRRRRSAELELAILAATDKLTGLANRRTFDERLESAWQHARASRTPVGLLLVDIDHFKALNDAIGHQGGDAVLALVGDCLDGIAARATDLAARYGGEEFVVLLPGATMDHAMAAAEALRASIAAIGEPHPRSPTGLLTVSVGVAVAVPTDGIRATDLLASADHALYRAKRTGRDRIMMADDLAAAA